MSSPTLLHTHEEVEEVLKRMATYMRNKNLGFFLQTFNEIRACGFSFVKINWDQIKGTYYGNHFDFRIHENLVDDRLEFKCSW